jgi:hypothetical protein
VRVHADDFAQLQLQFVDHTQWRYEVIRPVVLFADRTPQQRAQENQTHPATVRKLTRQFRQQGCSDCSPMVLKSWSESGRHGCRTPSGRS